MVSPSEGRGGARLTGAAAATPSGSISRYQILDKIGEGGMGALFLARDPAIDRLVAIKLLRAGFDSVELRDRFAREARAAGRLRHPNIVTIFDVGEHDGDPFIAMEFLAGETLHELIQAQARLSLARRLKLLEELCDGLAYAHRAGIIHRDIKPANLLVDSEGVLKILDFGIVRLDEGAVTQSGMLVGTLNYMSPEQVSGGPIDRRSDIFSVGLVAYELLSSRQAFPGTLRDGLLNRIATAAVEPLSHILPRLDPEVASIIERALEPAVEQRYADLTRMRNDLIRARKRIEAEEEAVGATDTGEAETMLLARPGVPTPVSGTPEVDGSGRVSGLLHGVEEAERALNAGEYRVALTLAGRSAAANPDDRNAALIMARAQTALLERGRALESGAVPAPPPVDVPAPVGTPVRVGPMSASAIPPPAFARVRPLWYAAAAAVVVLVVVFAVMGWIGQAPEPGGGVAVPADPSVQAPSRPSQSGAIPPPVTGSVESRLSAPADPQPAAPATTQAPLRETPPRPPTRQPTSVRPSSPVASPLPPPVLVVGRDLEAPRRIRYVEPGYPQSAFESRLEGNVGIELTIGRDGRVADARVTRSVAGLDQAALAAARQWEFVPVEVRGTTVPVIYQVTVAFTAPPATKPGAGEPPAPPPPAKPAAAPVKPTEAAKPPEAPPVDLRAEEAAVRALLQQYRSAWESRDADAVARVQRLSPDALRQVRETLAAAQAYRMTMDVQSVVVEPDARRSRARASIVRTYDPRAGNPVKSPAVTSTFTLEKRDGGWVITGIQ